jgi:hypothetical protein
MDIHENQIRLILLDIGQEIFCGNVQAADFVAITLQEVPDIEGDYPFVFADRYAQLAPWFIIHGC